MRPHLLLRALERAALEADLEAVDGVLVLAGAWRRRRLRRRAVALWRTAEATVEAAGIAPGPDVVARRVHIAQLAWLAAARSPWRSLAGVPDATAAAFYAGTGRAVRPDERAHDESPMEAAPPAARPARRAAWVAALLVGGAVAWAVMRPAPPLTEGPVGHALTADLTDWIVALDAATFGTPAAPTPEDCAAATSAAERARCAAFGPSGQDPVRDDQRLAELRARVVGDELRDALGPEAAARLAALLDATQALAEASDLPDGLSAHDARFRAALRDVDAALAAAGQPYFLDGDWIVNRDLDLQVALFVFGVVARHRVDAAATAATPALSVSTVHLERLDTLNWSLDRLGFTRRSMDVAVVLRDRIEEELVTFVGPALVADASMPLFAADERGGAWQDAVARAAGAVVRAHFARVLPDEAEHLASLGAALERRRSLFGGWRVVLAHDGYGLRVPGTLALDADLYAELKAALPDYQVEQLEEAQRDLESSAHREVFARMVEVYARSVERHEVQHRLDYARADAFPLPDVVRDALGVASDDALAEPTERRLERLAYELSAYTSELARAPGDARLNLALLARNVLHPRGPALEARVAVLVLDGLAAELGRDDLRIADRGDVRRRAAAALIALLEVDEVRLAAAAGALWTRWFEAPLPDLRRTDPP